MDGFSRKVLWLEAYSTNSDPAVIAGYFMQTVSKENGCPRVIRADHGTENAHIRHATVSAKKSTRLVCIYEEFHARGQSK